VFCICRLPDSTAHNIARGALVQCALCKEWYHQFYCDIEDIVIDTPKYISICAENVQNFSSIIYSIN
jgi:hypothetical protein